MNGRVLVKLGGLKQTLILVSLVGLIFARVWIAIHGVSDNVRRRIYVRHTRTSEHSQTSFFFTKKKKTFLAQRLVHIYPTLRDGNQWTSDSITFFSHQSRSLQADIVSALGYHRSALAVGVTCSGRESWRCQGNVWKYSQHIADF